MERKRVRPGVTISIGLTLFTWLTVAGCGGPVYTEPEMVEAEPPKVSYNFSTDEDLIEASTKARTYCSQYGATPAMAGTIVETADGSKRVTFECVTPHEMPPPSPDPMSTTYTTDRELLDAIQAAETYCARTGQTVSSRIVTNPDGTRTITFQCVAR